MMATMDFDLAAIPREFPQFGKSVWNLGRTREEVFGGKGSKCDAPDSGLKNAFTKTIGCAIHGCGKGDSERRSGAPDSDPKADRYLSSVERYVRGEHTSLASCTSLTGLRPHIDSFAPSGELAIDLIESQFGDRCGPRVDRWLVEELIVWYDWVALVNREIAGWSGEESLWCEPSFLKRKAYGYAFMMLIGPLLTYFPDTDFKAENCPSSTCKDTVTLSGMCIHSSEVGNFIYGAIARYFGMTWPQAWGGSLVGNRGKRTAADAAAVDLGYGYGDSGGRLPEFFKGHPKKLEAMGSDVPKNCAPCDEYASNAHVQLPPVTPTLNQLSHWRNHVVIPK